MKRDTALGTTGETSGRSNCSRVAFIPKQQSVLHKVSSSLPRCRHRNLKGEHSRDWDALAYHAGEPASSQQPPLPKKHRALSSQGCSPDLMQLAILAHLSKRMISHFHISRRFCSLSSTFTLGRSYYIQDSLMGSSRNLWSCSSCGLCTQAD